MCEFMSDYSVRVRVFEDKDVIAHSLTPSNMSSTAKTWKASAASFKCDNSIRFRGIKKHGPLPQVDP